MGVEQQHTQPIAVQERFEGVRVLVNSLLTGREAAGPNILDVEVGASSIGVRC